MRSIFAPLLALPAIATAAPYIPTMTGDQFVSIMSQPERRSPDDVVQREKAYSYLDGARDSAEGRVWCDVSQVKTPDLAYELADDIAKLPAAERKKNASLLLLDLLRRQLPCRGKGGKS